MPSNKYACESNQNQVMSIRIPLGLKNQIIEDMQTVGDFDSMTAWLQAAAREFLKSRKDEREHLGGGGIATKKVMPILTTWSKPLNSIFHIN